MRRRLIFLSTFAVALTSACGDHIVGEIPSDFLQPPPTNTKDAGETGYPAGPYGPAVGDIVANAGFAGYLIKEPTADVRGTGYLDPVTLDDLRNIEGYDFLLFNVAADWCGECKLEAREFPSQYEEWAPRGGLLITVVVHDTNYQPATRQTLDNWVGQQRTTYTTLHDPNGFVDTTFAPPTLPLNMVIDLDTMEILRTQIGSDPSIFDFFESKLDP